jgi:parallel beta-helix repeat protein
MRKSAILCILAACALAFAASDGAATGRATLVVDRDGVECASADFTSIQAAVDAAQPGDLIRVCPDLYAEIVVIDKPLTLKGDPDAVEAIDCFQPTLPELSSKQQAIVDPLGDGFSMAFKLEADDVVLEGLVVQGAYVGIDASDRFSGYRIDHNAIRRNTLFGMDFGSAGPRESRVDHNCIRENTFGVVSELDDDFGWRNTNLDDAERARRLTIPRDLFNARIDHNSTFRNTVGLDVAGPGIHNAVTMDHNVSREDSYGIALQNSADSALIANEIRPIVAGIAVGGANRRLQIVGDRVEAGRQGLGFARVNFFVDWFVEASTEVVIANNVFTGLTLQAIVVRASRLNESYFLENLASENGDGIQLEPGNTRNRLIGNVAERNRGHGIWSQGGTDNIFESNRMLGNALLDVRDDARESNTWSSNQCVTDYPAGTICGVG